MTVSGFAHAQPWLEQYQATLDPLYLVPPCQRPAMLKTIDEVKKNHSVLGRDLRESAGHLIESYGLKTYLKVVRDLEHVAERNEDTAYSFLACAPVILKEYGPTAYHRLAESLHAISETDKSAATEFLYHSPAFLSRHDRKYLRPLAKAVRLLAEQDPDAAKDLLRWAEPVKDVLRMRKRPTAVDVLLEYIHDLHSANLVGSIINPNAHRKAYARRIEKLY